MTNKNNLTNKEIGNRIKSRRTALKLTLQDVASNVGVAPSTIQRYENGTISQYKLPVLESIAKALDVNPVWLVKKDAPIQLEQKVSKNLGLEDQLIKSFQKLNQNGKIEALKRISELTHIPIYTD